MTVLYHYTCAHGYAALGEKGDLTPPVLLWPERCRWIPTSYLIWLTDMPRPQRDALGLTMYSIGCERTEYRYRALDLSEIVPWGQFRRTFAREHGETWLEAIEGEERVRPSHWFVATVPVPAVYDPA
jgi:hypothetical protein